MLSFALSVILLIGACFVIAGNKTPQETKNETKQQTQNGDTKYLCELIDKIGLS